MPILYTMRESVRSRKIREPAVSGLFYPGSAPLLKEQVRSLLDTSFPCLDTARAITSPHGCFDFSGSIAAMAWKAASGRQEVQTVVILSPYHRAADDSVYFTESEVFGTPSGKIEVDLELVSELQDCATGFTVDDIPHLVEHGIEVQLPFMRAIFPEAKLVPILMGRPSVRSTISLAKALGLVFANCMDHCLFVISSNITADRDRAKAGEKAGLLLSRALSGDWKAILDTSVAEEYPCGSSCLAAFMASSLAADLSPQVLATGDSAGFGTCEEAYVVEYAALAFA